LNNSFRAFCAKDRPSLQNLGYFRHSASHYWLFLFTAPVVVADLSDHFTMAA
jgi:hypothetical protein